MAAPGERKERYQLDRLYQRDWKYEDSSWGKKREISMRPIEIEIETQEILQTLDI